jgi:phospholipid transport system transporter-binding protein
MPSLKYGHVLDQASLELDSNNAHSYLLAGVLSRHTIQDIRKKSLTLFKDKKTIIVNLSQVTRSDSSGVALLVEWMRMTVVGKQSIAFQDIPDYMMDIAKISGLNKILTVK